MGEALKMGITLLLCGVVPAGLFLYVAHWDSEKKLKARKEKKRILEEAQKGYLASLQALKSRPNDSELREQTLAAGREFARIAREGGQETLFDEVALLNDMNAVAGVSVGSTTPEPSGGPSVRDRLRHLAELREEGLITESEYNERRNAILSEI